MTTNSVVRFPQLFGNLDYVLNDLFNAPVTKTSFQPKANVYEKEDGYHIALVAPGFKKEQLTVKVENDLLTIAGTVSEQNNNDNGKQLRKEFVSKSFSRTFHVDESIKADGIVAKFEDGILNIWVPKIAPTPKVQADITIQ
jgi:HSP20 family protein